MKTELIEASTSNHGFSLWSISPNAILSYSNQRSSQEKLVELGLVNDLLTCCCLIYIQHGVRVTRLIDLRRVSKEPGCSWIGINSWTIVG